MIKFSVVMAVYQGDASEHVIDAIDSVLGQTLAPSELLIVVDGPVNNKLDAVLSNASTFDTVRIVKTPLNNGPGASRHLAISEAKFDIIAIMDADDICLSNRFERQLPILESGQADVVGAWVEEFDNNLGDLGRVRRVPANHEQIFEYGKWRQPLNHVTVMFRRVAYLKAGGYQSIRYVEDYDLIVRMLTNGIKFYNIQEVLVCVRIGKDMLKRRSGIPYLAAELRLFHRMYLSGYLNSFQLFLNLLTRLVSRLLPHQFLGMGYDKWLRHHNRELTR